MKKLLFIVSILSALSLSGQKIEEAESPKENENKIETIKIVNGDTVYHEVRLISGSMSKNERKMKTHMYHGMSGDEMPDDLEEILKDIDIYINLDDRKKKMIIHKMKMYDEDFDSLIEKWEEDDDMIIDMKNGKNQMKIIKIEMDDKNGEEVKVIEIHRDRKGEDDVYRSQERERRHSEKKDPLKIYPNPANNEVNLEFEVMEGKAAELTIMDMNGRKIFNKTYTEAGMIKEKIKLKEGDKGMVVITLLDPNRTISKSIIIE